MNNQLQPHSHPWIDDDDLLNADAPSSLRGGDPSFTRFLPEQRRNADGTLAVLMIVFALFCFIWAPVMLRRCRGRGSGSNEDDVHDLARFEAEARAVRATLQRMSMIGNRFMEDQTERTDPHLEHRREFLDNALLTKKIIFQLNSIEDGDDDEQKEKDDDDYDTSSNKDERKPLKRQKSNVIVLVNTTKHKKEKSAPPSPTTTSTTTEPPEDKEEETNVDNTEEEQEPPETTNAQQDAPTAVSHQIEEEQDDSSQLEPCSICLTEYRDGDAICWSHHEKCNHFFHKSCIQTWLLTHEECPCCRQDFLCLWGDDEDDSEQHRPTIAQNRRLRRTTFSGTSSLDWAEDLVDEVQQRIIQRQRQLQSELQLRDRQLQIQQRINILSAANPVQNTVISVDDVAAGLLLYRHFPMQFASDPRRRLATDDANVEVAHFGRAAGSFQTYRPDQPVLLGTASGSTIVEMVERSSRRRLLRQGDLSHPRFLSGLQASNQFYNSSRAPTGRMMSTTTTPETDREQSTTDNAAAESSSENANNDDDDNNIITASA